ncbi:hypothetical protein BaRGS_00015784 [Batillaria attramentaria]|uniref:Uncharacterized protein n=1 Tax=Batillaria attramentaria TaxID=370345 RepID=A0ABD0L0V9_9CAEN
MVLPEINLLCNKRWAGVAFLSERVPLYATRLSARRSRQGHANGGWNRGLDHWILLAVYPVPALDSKSAGDMQPTITLTIYYCDDEAFWPQPHPRTASRKIMLI